MSEHASTQVLVGEATAARLLDLAPKTLQRWRWSGRGPVHYKVGGSVKYRVQDLEEFILAGRRQPTSGQGDAGDARAA